MNTLIAETTQSDSASETTGRAVGGFQMETLKGKILQWSEDKGITGPQGKGTPIAQAKKVVEEANEFLAAVEYWETFPELRTPEAWNKVVDGIGDVEVTITIAAEMYNTTVAACTQLAYDEIANRTGTMIGGSFVKSSPQTTDPDDDFNEPLGQACQLDDEECTSCQ